MEKGLTTQGEPFDVYDDLERLSLQALSFEEELIALRQQAVWQAEMIACYQQSDINLRFQVERLTEHIDHLKKRSLLQRIRNTDPTY